MLTGSALAFCLKTMVVVHASQPYVRAMRLIPTHCDSCLRAALVSADAIESGWMTCRECGGAARTLPGQSYGPEDAQLFDDLQATLREAQLTPLNAHQLAVELQDRQGVPGRGLKRLARLLPSLAILELIVSNEPISMRKAEGMLATLLDVIAARRSHSGVMPAVGALRRTKTGSGLM